MKRIIILFFLLSACSQGQTNQKMSISNVNFSKDLTLEEFRIKLEEYAYKSPFPKIDN